MSTAATTAKCVSQVALNPSKKLHKSLTAALSSRMEVDVVDKQDNEEEVVGPLFDFLLLKQNIEHSLVPLDEDTLIAISMNYIKYNLDGRNPADYMIGTNMQFVVVRESVNVVCGPGWT
ncbi:hypothetical protein FRC10_000614, partial [Ceratobasidium sp. 414]